MDRTLLVDYFPHFIAKQKGYMRMPERHKATRGANGENILEDFWTSFENTLEEMVDGFF